MNAAQLQLIAIPGLPAVAAGDDLARLLVDRADAADIRLQAGDVIVVAQKILSKAEGRHVDLASIRPSATALELSQIVNKDPRLVELVLSQSKRIVRTAKDVLIVQHQLGYIMANAGIDQSNVEHPDGTEYALLLPADPDASAQRLREDILRLSGAKVGVVISDSFGRPWRVGTVGVAIGAAGLPATLDLRGSTDLFGRTLKVTVVGHADEIASAASLLMGQGREARPVIVVRGLTATRDETRASSLVRPEKEDLFR
jgi:coenzyme F420-0:L-glutamate ligase/coenzyme F420-1:gamma-L-glutamate ligase